MDVDTAAATRVVLVALADAHAAAEVARLAAMGVAYAADRRSDLEATAMAQKAAHTAGLAAWGLAGAMGALEHALGADTGQG